MLTKYWQVVENANSMPPVQAEQVLPATRQAYRTHRNREAEGVRQREIKEKGVSGVRSSRDRYNRVQKYASFDKF